MACVHVEMSCDNDGSMIATKPPVIMGVSEKKPQPAVDRSNMKQVEYVVASWPRFRGMYWCVYVDDLDSERADNLKPEEKDNIERITQVAQDVFDRWHLEGREIPPPKFEEYAEWESDDCDPTYHRVLIWVAK